MKCAHAVVYAQGGISVILHPSSFILILE